MNLIEEEDDSRRYFEEIEQFERYQNDPAFKAEYDKWLEGLNQEAEGDQNGTSSKESGK